MEIVHFYLWNDHSHLIQFALNNCFEITNNLLLHSSVRPNLILLSNNFFEGTIIPDHCTKYNWKSIGLGEG